MCRLRRSLRTATRCAARRSRRRRAGARRLRRLIATSGWRRRSDFGVRRDAGATATRPDARRQRGEPQPAPAPVTSTACARRYPIAADPVCDLNQIIVLIATIAVLGEAVLDVADVYALPTILGERLDVALDDDAQPNRTPDSGATLVLRLVLGRDPIGELLQPRNGGEEQRYLASARAERVTRPAAVREPDPAPRRYRRARPAVNGFDPSTADRSMASASASGAGAPDGVAREGDLDVRAVGRCDTRNGGRPSTCKVRLLPRRRRVGVDRQHDGVGAGGDVLALGVDRPSSAGRAARGEFDLGRSTRAGALALHRVHRDGAATRMAITLWEAGPRDTAADAGCDSRSTGARLAGLARQRPAASRPTSAAASSRSGSSTACIAATSASSTAHLRGPRSCGCRQSGSPSTRCPSSCCAPRSRRRCSPRSTAGSSCSASSASTASYVIEFTTAFSQREPEDFVQSVLVDQLRAVDVVVGANFRFGRRAAGDVSTLDAAGRTAGFMVDAVELAGAPTGSAARQRPARSFPRR